MKIEEIAPYLPYGVKMIFEKSGKIIELSGIQKTDGGNLIFICFDKFYESTIWSFKPIIRPLSDLIEPCLPDGKIPYKVLGWEIMCGDLGELIDWGDSHKGIVNSIEFIPEIQQLLSWHFDVFGLIEKGEAVDINTLK